MTITWCQKTPISNDFLFFFFSLKITSIFSIFFSEKQHILLLTEDKLLHDDKMKNELRVKVSTYDRKT